MHRVIIDAPFGNFLSSQNATSIVGPFSPRGGDIYGKLRALVHAAAFVRWSRRYGLVSTPPHYSINIKHLIDLPPSYLKDKILSIACSDSQEMADAVAAVRIVGKHAGAAGVEIQLTQSVADDHSKLSSILDLGHDLLMPTVVRTQGQSSDEVARICIGEGYKTLHVSPGPIRRATNLGTTVNHMHAVRLIYKAKEIDESATIIGSGWLRDVTDIVSFGLAGATVVDISSLVSRPRQWFPGSVSMLVERAEFLMTESLINSFREC